MESAIDYCSVALALGGAAVLVATTAFGQRATYGRYSSESRMPKVDARAAWVVQELPSAAAPFVSLVLYNNAQPARVAILALFALHYLLRTFVYGLSIRGGKPTPVHLMLAAAAFCTFNGFLQSAAIFCRANDDDGRFPRARTAIGCGLFFVGMIINHHSDNVLRNLRKPGETGYKIPRGGLFRYVSGANFFGEIMEWLGFALAARTPASWAFAWFTLANIGPRAFHHHRYYKEKFDGYPEERKALIPFLL